VIRRKTEMAQGARAFGRQRQQVSEPRRDVATGGTQSSADARFPQLDAVPRIAGPQLVAAVARESNRYALARRRRHVVRRHRGGIAERLVEVPREARQELFDLRMNDRRREPASEMLRDALRLVQLVVFLVGEADRRREHL
jgi:hypothetical protein